jgi:hypothetical protein
MVQMVGRKLPMTDGSNDEPSPEATFDLLASDLRFDILRALNETNRPLAFSELYEAVDVQDSGQFNYHLEKLVGPFVNKSEAGYSLTVAGKRAVGVVYAGAFDDGYSEFQDADPVPASGSCYACGAPLHVTFGDSRVRAECSSCEWQFSAPSVPPGALSGWDRTEVPSLVHRWTRRHLVSTDLGLCEYCDGRVTTTLCRPGDEAAPGWFTPGETEYDVLAVYNCQVCKKSSHAAVAFAALARPPVVAFYQDHGVDVRTCPMWEIGSLADTSVQVLQETPLRVELTATLDEKSRRFVFDREMALLEESPVE